MNKLTCTVIHNYTFNDLVVLVLSLNKSFYPVLLLLLYIDMLSWLEAVSVIKLDSVMYVI